MIEKMIAENCCKCGAKTARKNTTRECGQGRRCPECGHEICGNCTIDRPAPRRSP